MKKQSSVNAAIKAVDNELFDLVKGIDILNAVAPLNYRQQKSEFLSSNFSVNPEFVYAKHSIDGFKRKRQLFSLPVEAMLDEDLTELYSAVIESYVDKIDQFKSIGTPQFLYDSLRYYGEPNDKDLRNANFILHLPSTFDEQHESFITAEEIVRSLTTFAEQQGYRYQIKLDDSMIANILVSGTTVKVNSAASISTTEVNALLHHELGVHLVTTLNGRNQPLKVLSLGCPVNTMTQEGLAILSEYLAGFMTLSRLKVLALRVLAVDSLIDEKDFKKTFLFLKEEHGIPDDLAFTITARVYRGGGLTKDYLYLRGLHAMLNAYETRPDFTNLLSGKVSIEHLPLVSRAIDKGYFNSPELISPAIARPVANDAIKQFVAHAIK